MLITELWGGLSPWDTAINNAGNDYGMTRSAGDDHDSGYLNYLKIGSL